MQENSREISVLEFEEKIEEIVKNNLTILKISLKNKLTNQLITK